MKKTGFDLRKFRRFRKKVSGNRLQNVYIGWGRKYLTWIKQRYKINAAGGGEWPALKGISYQRALGSPLLASRTGKKRGRSGRAQLKLRYQQAATKAKILIDTGTLFGALSVGKTGNLFKLREKGIRVGFADVQGHKDSKLTIRKIAMRHQSGDPSTHLPQRKILHIPNQAFRQRMLKDLSREIIRIGHSI